MITLHGEIKNPIKKTAMFSGFLIQASFLTALLLAGLYTTTGLHVDLSKPSVPIFFHPVQTPPVERHTTNNQTTPNIVDRIPVRTFTPPHANGPVSPNTNIQVIDGPYIGDGAPSGGNVMIAPGTGFVPGSTFTQSIPSVPPTPAVTRITRGGNVQAAQLVRRVDPPYPVLAKQARVSGKVILEALIAADGTIEKLHVLTGHPLLTKAAVDAVSLWMYKPTLLNGVPVEVMTTVEVNFILGQ
jgi:TonB family protein